MPRGTIPLTAPLSPTAPDLLDDLDDFELIGDDLDILLDSVLNGQDETEVPILSVFGLFVCFFNPQTRPGSKLLH